MIQSRPAGWRLSLLAPHCSLKVYFLNRMNFTTIEPNDKGDTEICENRKIRSISKNLMLFLLVQFVGCFQLPTAELDVDLEEFADICLGLLDIPISKSRIQSLHCFFSLYREFKSSQHFKNLAMEKRDNIDRMEL